MSDEHEPHPLEGANEEPDVVFGSLESLLAYAGYDSVDGLEDWVANGCELDPTLLLETEGELVVLFPPHRNGMVIEFPTTLTDFWAAVDALEEQVIEDVEASSDDEGPESTSP